MAYLGNTIINGNLKVINGINVAGIITTKGGAVSWIETVNNANGAAIEIPNTGAYGWIRGKTKNGKIVISTYASNDDNLYFGYAETGKTANSYTKQMVWNGSNGTLTVNNVAATVNGYSIAASVPSGAKFTDTVYTHPNTVTAGTAGTSSATSGSTLAVPYVTYNANGHITATGTHTHTITGFAASSHTHSYLPLSGGTLTGSLTIHNSGTAIAWKAPANITCSATANSQEWSIDLAPGSYTGTYWHVYSSKLGRSILCCYPDNGNVTVSNGNFTVGGTSGTTYLQLPSGIKLY